MEAVIGLSMTACDQADDPAPQQWTVSLIQNHMATDNATVASFVHTNGVQFPASVATPGARSGWTFTGFWTTRNGGTQYFNAGGARTTAAGNPRTLHNDLRLYAQWHQGTTPPPVDPGPPGPGPGPTPPGQQPDVLTPIDFEGFYIFAESGPVTFTVGTTHDGEFVELRMTGRTADWHGLDIQFPELITEGFLTATSTYNVRVTGRGGASATGQFMIQGMQPGHNWGTPVPLVAGQPFTLTRSFTMQAGPGPWAGDPRWAAARLTTDAVGANSDIIFTGIEILRVPGNTVVFCFAELVNDDGYDYEDEPSPSLPQLTGTVSITGTPRVGNTLSVNTANLGGSGAISFQWRRGNTDISPPRGTGSTLALTAEDVGSWINVVVRRAGYTFFVLSESVGPVTAATVTPPPQQPPPQQPPPQQPPPQQPPPQQPPPQPPPPTGTRPSAPTGVTATAQSATTIRVSWNAVQGADGYRVEVGSSATGPWSVFAGMVNPITNTFWDHTGLSPNTRRWYRIIAVNSAGASNPSAIVNATTGQARPNPPFGNSMMDNRTRNSITITHNTSIGATQYEVAHGPSRDGPWTSLGWSAQLTRTATGLAPNTAVYFKVRARSAPGYESNWTINTVPFRTLP